MQWRRGSGARAGALPAILLLLGTVCWAEESAATGVPAADEEPDGPLETRVVGLLRARLSHPQRVSGAVGLMIARLPSKYDCTTVCGFRGWVFQAEPGSAGGQLSAGYARLAAEKGRSRHFLSSVFVGFGIKAALLRTWDEAGRDLASQTFLGAEGEVTVARVNLSLSLFRNLSRAPGRSPWLIGGGIGWGF